MTTAESSARPALAAGREHLAAGDARLTTAIAAFREQLAAARRQVAAWPLRDAGFEVLAAADGSFGADSAHTLLELARRRQAELRAAMQPPGARLYAERRKPLARRYRTYWRAWQSAAATGDELPKVA
jgi:hypothetical protein